MPTDDLIKSRPSIHTSDDQNPTKDMKPQEGIEQQDSVENVGSSTVKKDSSFLEHASKSIPQDIKSWTGSDVQSSSTKFVDNENILNDQSVEQVNEGDDDLRTFSNIIWFLLVCLVCCMSLASTPEDSNSNTVEISNEKGFKKCDEFISLQKKFPNQADDLWKTLKIGVEGVLNREPTMPSVFLLLHNDSSTVKLIENIAQAAAMCFDSKTIIFGSEDFSADEVISDFGVAIQKFKNAGVGVYLVKDLNNIPAESAKAFHFICDTENPVVKKMVIFLTLTVQLETGNPTVIAENLLTDLWGPKLKNNELSPLIIRVTDQVLWLHPE